MTRLHDLYTGEGQSPWVDNLKRSYIVDGGLAHLVDLGIRGVTSNPTIMTNAIEAGSDYDEQFADVINGGTSVTDAYWDLVLADISGAVKVLRPVYDSAEGRDGFVSVEVSPALAHDSAGTVEAAQKLHQRINEPNLLVKIPATVEGLVAIEETIASGMSVNVTLIFSLQRYEAVLEAYIHGLERFVASGGDPAHIASVASFFVSRVDTEVDRRLETLAHHEAGTARAEKALALRGTAAIAQAKLAYEIFTTTFAGPRSVALNTRGAQQQRPLWASTSTKNPAYSDLLYVEQLIGPGTVDTLPPATIDAFIDHGRVARTIDTDVDVARTTLAEIREVGVDLDDVTDQLESEGVTVFTKSFDELDERLTQKASVLGVNP